MGRVSEPYSTEFRTVGVVIGEGWFSDWEDAGDRIRARLEACNPVIYWSLRDIQEQGIRCVRRFGSMQTARSLRHDAFEPRRFSTATGPDVKRALYVAYTFNEFGGIESVDCVGENSRFPAFS